MKRSKQETAATHKKIVAVASEEFRKNGIAGTALADLMAVAGLTHGGFYRHFESKEQLVERSLDVAATELAEDMESTFAKAAKGNGLQSAIADYLSIDHRDNAAGGCPFVALGGELARGGVGVREVTSAGLLRLTDVIANHLEGMTPAAAKKRALVIVSTMIGALSMARMVTDPEISASILREARKHLMQ